MEVNSPDQSATLCQQPRQIPPIFRSTSLATPLCPITCSAARCAWGKAITDVRAHDRRPVHSADAHRLARSPLGSQRGRTRHPCGAGSGTDVRCRPYGVIWKVAPTCRQALRMSAYRRPVVRPAANKHWQAFCRTPRHHHGLEFGRRAPNGDHFDRADFRFVRPNIQIYDAHVVDLYQCVCVRYLVGVKGAETKGAI
jgi:hypothetical protein